MKTSMLKDFGYAPKCRANLVSMTIAQQARITIVMEAWSTKMKGPYKGQTVFVRDSSSFGICELTKMKPASSGTPSMSFFDDGEDDAMQLAYRRTCHTAVSTLQKMESSNSVEIDEESWDRM